jgi:NADH dehydrogenase (ubiquinone) 1 alpha subcomplex subunit 8
MRDNCLKEFDAHWNCLEWNNHAYNLCRKPERTLNKCMFEKLVSTATLPMLLHNYYVSFMSDI